MPRWPALRWIRPTGAGFEAVASNLAVIGRRSAAQAARLQRMKRRTKVVATLGPATDDPLTAELELAQLLGKSAAFRIAGEAA